MHGMASRKIRLGIVGCGDVAHRRYLPTFELISNRVEIRGCCDPRPGAAERAVERVRAWSPAAHAYADLDAMLRDAELDAVVNITPAPAHAATSQACLEAGLHVYSEKPLGIQKMA